MHLARWNYTKEEWTNYLHWKTRKKGLLFFLLQKLRPVKTQHVPEIRITDDRVWINNTHEPFRNSQRRFMEIHISDTGCVNVLEINYEKRNKICGIKVPIPRGKLREAFEIRERLMMDNGSIG
ncbi:MAG: hypothetical protein ACT4OJ_00130 [Bacteroidota bacterium]